MAGRTGGFGGLAYLQHAGGDGGDECRGGHVDTEVGGVGLSGVERHVGGPQQRAGDEREEGGGVQAAGVVDQGHARVAQRRREEVG